MAFAPLVLRTQERVVEPLSAANTVINIHPNLDPLIQGRTWLSLDSDSKKKSAPDGERLVLTPVRRM